MTMNRYAMTPVVTDDAVKPGKLRLQTWVPPALQSRAETPLSPDQYDVYTVRQADLGRLDNVAWQFYQDVTMWWVIAYWNSIANQLTDMVAGQALVIPKKQLVLALFDAEAAS